jgi:hypothetical protein
VIPLVAIPSYVKALLAIGLLFLLAGIILLANFYLGGPILPEQRLTAYALAIVGIILIGAAGWRGCGNSCCSHEKAKQ